MPRANARSGFVPLLMAIIMGTVLVTVLYIYDSKASNAQKAQARVRDGVQSQLMMQTAVNQLRELALAGEGLGTSGLQFNAATSKFSAPGLVTATNSNNRGVDFIDDPVRGP